ncbi:MAG: hypothetical protein KatS3mg002_0350 [Candidatus Woesearchaeota archaeon]|nr:MAG: hypothetical protein KatS3mg002_0350 [Candidatus Woesearchaeota archaeon]
MKRKKSYVPNVESFVPPPTKDYLQGLEGVKVTLEECNGDFDKMMSRFKKKTSKHEITKEVFERLYYKTKSQKRKEKQKNAQYMRQKETEKFEKKKEKYLKKKHKKTNLNKGDEDES